MRLEELKNTVAEASRVFVLTDENVAPLWLAEALHWLGCESSVDMVIKPGERQKSLMNARRIWKRLTDCHADRNALLINLGGGVITDLGGFAASTYKRGIRFVNVPTTLLGMVDAAIGGKTGINFQGCKNQLGTFAEPLDVMVNPICLSTLPEREILSGMSEMLKYGFVYDSDLLKVDTGNYQEYILRAGDIKRSITEIDKYEMGPRKVLNFGHTIGHAIESFCLSTKHPLLHGEAVALGMGAALWLSVEDLGLDESVLHLYENKLPMLLSQANVRLSEKDMPFMRKFLVQDKKSKNGKMQFVLLYGVGEPIWDVEVNPDLIKEALSYIINKVRME